MFFYLHLVIAVGYGALAAYLARHGYLSWPTMAWCGFALFMAHVSAKYL